MPGRRTNYYRDNIFRKNKSGIIRTVEDENKFICRMQSCDPFECFKNKIAYTLQVIFQQKPCIYCYGHWVGGLIFLKCSIARSRFTGKILSKTFVSTSAIF